MPRATTKSRSGAVAVLDRSATEGFSDNDFEGVKNVMTTDTIEKIEVEATAPAIAEAPQAPPMAVFSESAPVAEAAVPAPVAVDLTPPPMHLFAHVGRGRPGWCKDFLDTLSTEHPTLLPMEHQKGGANQVLIKAAGRYNMTVSIKKYNGLLWAVRGPDRTPVTVEAAVAAPAVVEAPATEAPAVAAS